MKVKAGQIYALYCHYWDTIDIILITKEHDELDGFWFYDYEWINSFCYTVATSIITPKHLKNWKYIGELE